LITEPVAHVAIFTPTRAELEALATPGNKATPAAPKSPPVTPPKIAEIITARNILSFENKASAIFYFFDLYLNENNMKYYAQKKIKVHKA
jgi:hypothetical protein